MSDLLNGFNNGRDKSDGIGGNKPTDQLANDVDTSESGLHLQNVNSLLFDFLFYVRGGTQDVPEEEIRREIEIFLANYYR